MVQPARQRDDRGRKQRMRRYRGLLGRPKRSEGGFTLIELLVVVAIIGIIAAIAIANLQAALDKSKQKKSMASMRTLSSALQAYQIDNGRFPNDSITNLQLRALLSPDMYNSVDVTDGWGFDISYESSVATFTLESYGKDGADGPADITHATRFEFDYDLILVDGQFAYSPETY